jgi:hypothetical protein
MSKLDKTTQMDNQQSIDSEFSGIYHGTLWYGDGYPAYKKNAELTFQMNISEENNWFTGTAKDIDGVGTSPDEAKVEGIINGIHIEFNKVYRRLHYDDGSGNTIFEEAEGHPIYYEGTYNEESGYYEGTWAYLAQKRVFFFFKKIINTGSGTFRLRKIGEIENQ